jgi:hypothetical protein
MCSWKLIKSKRFILFLIVFLFSLFSSYLIYTTAAHYNSDNSLSLLANQFNRGHIALPINSGLPLGDVADYYYNFYLYFGPFPSIVLMPFVFLFGKNFSQSALGILSIILSFFAIYKTSKSFKFGITDSLWLSLFFVSSTVLLATSLINISAYQVESLAVPLILFALMEYFSKKRSFLIGMFLGLAVLTRITLVLATIFFVLEFLRKRLSKKQLIFILIPVIAAFLLYGGYNQRRFHSFLETGVRYSINLKTYPLDTNVQYGLFNPINIPGNLYSLLLMPPDPVLKNSSGFTLKFPYFKANPWGMAIWFTSPLFLILLYKFKKNQYSLSAGLTSLLIAIPIFCFYSIGFSQYGYRYLLDFLPFLFLLLLPSFNSKLSKKEIALIIIGVVFNAIYITSLWGQYPLFGMHL